MTEVEVEAETTQIETETVTVCDACGRPADTDSHTLAVDPPSTASVTPSPRFVHEIIMRAESGMGELPPPSAPHGAWDLSRSADSSLTTGIDYDDTVDICTDCFETTFDAVVDEADVQLLADAYEDADDEEDEEETDRDTLLSTLDHMGMMNLLVIAMGMVALSSLLDPLIALAIGGGLILAFGILFAVVRTYT